MLSRSPARTSKLQCYSSTDLLPNTSGWGCLLTRIELAYKGSTPDLFLIFPENPNALRVMRVRFQGFQKIAVAILVALVLLWLRRLPRPVIFREGFTSSSQLKTCYTWYYFASLPSFSHICSHSNQQQSSPRLQ